MYPIRDSVFFVKELPLSVYFLVVTHAFASSGEKDDRGGRVGQGDIRLVMDQFLLLFRSGFVD